MNTIPTSTMNTIPTSTVDAVPTPAMNTIPTSTVDAVPTSTVDTVPTSTVDNTVDTVPTSSGVKSSKRLSKSDRWKLVEPFLDSIKDNVEFVKVLVENFKPSTGGEHLKVWDRRVENVVGDLVAKQCIHTGLWYVNDEKNHKASAFSKGKYTTKNLLSVLREAKDEVLAEVSSAMMTGQCVTDANKLAIFNPNSKEADIYEAVVALYPEKIANVATDYNEDGRYLGATQEEAVSTLTSRGVSCVIS